MPRSAHIMSLTQHTLAPGESALQLNIPILLPGVDDERDGCVSRLEQRLMGQTGIRRVHLDHDETGHPLLCLHYDPNLMPLEKLERLARDEGAAITGRFKHETFPIKGMAQGTNVSNIEDIVRRVPGVLSVSVNYAVEKMWVEYDSTLGSRDAIAKATRALGYRVGEPLSPGQNPSQSALTPLAGRGTPAPTLGERVAEIDPHAGHDHDHEGHEAHGEASGGAHAGHKHESHEGHAHDDEGHEPHGKGASGHEGHNHGEVDPNANWIQRNWELSMSLFSGLLLGIGFFGEQFFGLLPGVALAFYLASYVAGGYDLARHTVPTILRGKFDVEFLMLLGAVGAGFLNQWAEGAFLLFLFSFGHALEHFAMESARNAIGALGKLTPKIARIKDASGEREVPVEQIQVGQIAVVRPGDRLPVDGKILAGNSAIDQSPITGESLPVEKAVGENVFAGTINGDGALEVEVTKLSSDSTISRVLKMVEEAQSQKSPSQTFTDKFEKILVPCVLVVAFLAAIVPPLLGRMTWGDAIFRAISTIVAASPCALALATPSAVLAAIARAAQNGVLIKGGVHLENLGTLQAIAFDKTGTLTRGKPEVADIIPFGGVSADELLSITAAVETRSSHPLAQAVVRRASELKLALPVSGDLQTLKGRGAQAEVGGQLVRIGNVKMMEEAQIPLPPELAAQVKTLSESGKPIMIVSRGQQVIGVVALADQIRDESKTALAKLREIGVSTLVMLTGDNAKVAAHIAPQAGVTEFRGDLLPEDKVGAIKSLLEKHGQVAMVGDGVNDAPALANATVGIAMGAGGTDVALETADVALMGDDLSKLPFAVALSRQAKSIIRQNLWISLGVIALLVPSTLFGFARLGVAVIFHEGSTLIVVANALRLLRFKLR